jgi:predicted transcriptional regulator
MKRNLHTTKLELIQWLSTIDNPIILEKVLAIRNNEKEDHWASLSALEKDSINKGIEDADAGKLNDHDQARKIYGKWL